MKNVIRGYWGAIIVRPRLIQPWSGMLMAVLLVAACLGAADSALAQEAIGRVKESRGSAAILRGGASLPAVSGMALRAGDILRTAENSGLNVGLADGTRIIVGPGSQVSLDDYAYDARSREGNMLVGILKGTMRMITGLLAPSNPGKAVVKMPTATVGIRGTDFIVEVP